MHDHAGSLVNDQNIGILVKNFERKLLGLCIDRLPDWLGNLNALPTPQLDSGLGRHLPIHQHASSAHPLLKLRAGVSRQPCTQELVQPAGRAGRHFKMVIRIPCGHGVELAFPTAFASECVEGGFRGIPTLGFEKIL